MAENGFFATAFRGFRKEDVLNYIDSLNTAHFEELSAAQQETEILREQKNALEEKLPALEQEVAVLREKAAVAEETQKTLETTKQHLSVVEEENRQMGIKLAATEEAVSRCDRLQNENEILKQQLNAQQTELDTFERMFGESRDATAFVRENVRARIQESQRRTERTLSEVEQMTVKLTAELEELRSRTAAIRSETAAANEKDAAALSAWFQQFDKKVTSDTDTHFFR